MRVLITGISGFVGSHLATYIAEHHPDVEIFGLVRWRSPRDAIKHLDGKIELANGDLRDLSSLLTVIDDVEPDRIFHLAAQSYVQTSFTAPVDTLTTNVLGTCNLLEAIRITEQDPLVHICSSSEVYGQVAPDETPIKETNPFRPASPYAVSKVGEDMLALQYWLSYGVRTIRTRMFTHTGPGRGDVFAESAFAKQIAEVEAGKRGGFIRVGNLDSIRTVADVRDAVRAYWLLLEHCEPGEVYNIGGDTTVTVRDILEQLIALSTSDHILGYKPDAALLRPSDVTLQIPDTSKFREATGWAPEIPLEQTLRDLLDWHRSRM